MRTDNKLNSHMTAGLAIKPGPHWWEASALTTAPFLLLLRREGKEFRIIWFILLFCRARAVMKMTRMMKVTTCVIILSRDPLGE